MKHALYTLLQVVINLSMICSMLKSISKSLSTITNSSPPSLAIVSFPLTQAKNESANLHRNLSPIS